MRLSFARIELYINFLCIYAFSLRRVEETYSKQRQLLSYGEFNIRKCCSSSFTVVFYASQRLSIVREKKIIIKKKFDFLCVGGMILHKTKKKREISLVNDDG